jgi:hypothetical protein
MKRLLVLVALVAASVAVTATTASADYGPGAKYQVELSANIPGTQGGGIWLWLGLYPNSSGTATPSSPGHGDYAGSDCGHGGEGAASDKGDVTWYYAGDGNIVIEGVTYNGLPTDPFHGDFSPYSATLTVPADPGHYTGADDSYTSLPYYIPGGIGFTQLQVAPGH